MITRDKIRIYSKYGGDTDHLARINNQKDMLIISDNDWSVIDGFVTDIGLVKKNLASTKFTEELSTRLERLTDNEITIQELEKLSDKFY